MALATSYATRDTPSPTSALLASLLALRSARSPVPKWLRADAVGSHAGLRGGSLAHAIDRASQTGLLECKGSGRSMAIRPGPMASGVLGLAVKGKARRPVDPADLGCHPTAPIVAELAGEPSACPSAESMADRLGLDAGELWDALEVAASAGLVELWDDHPQGPSATLSALAAGRLGLRLSADGSRWLRADDRDPTEDAPLAIATESDVSGDDGWRRFDGLPDPGAVGGLDALIGTEDDAIRLARLPLIDAESATLAAEVADDRKAGRRPAMADVAGRMERAAANHLERAECSRWPGPRLLIGIGLTWPVLTPDATPARRWAAGDGPCPACLGVPIGRVAYCMLCDASGLDGFLPLSPEIPPDPEPVPIPKRRRTTGGAGRVAYRKGNVRA